MRQLQSSVKQVARAGPAKKRGVRVACARKHFFVLIFLRSAARLLFVSRQKVRELEEEYYYS